MKRLFIGIGIVVAGLVIADPSPYDSVCVDLTEEAYNSMPAKERRALCLSLWTEGGYTEPVDSGWKRITNGTNVIMRYEISKKQAGKAFSSSTSAISNLVAVAKVDAKVISISITNDVKELTTTTFKRFFPVKAEVEVTEVTKEGVK